MAWINQILLMSHGHRSSTVLLLQKLAYYLVLQAFHLRQHDIGALSILQLLLLKILLYKSAGLGTTLCHLSVIKPYPDITRCTCTISA